MRCHKNCGLTKDMSMAGHVTFHAEETTVVPLPLIVKVKTVYIREQVKTIAEIQT